MFKEESFGFVESDTRTFDQLIVHVLRVREQ